MKTAFLTEMGFQGKISPDHTNMRTEFAWMCALQADHFNIHQYEQVQGYDIVFIIFPKATVKLNACGVEMSTTAVDKDISIYAKPLTTILKQNNEKVCNVQEGPSWFFNEYNLVTQFNFYNLLAECDVLFAHNEYDTHFYRGLFPSLKTAVIPTLMLKTAIQPLLPDPVIKENKAIIGGNFCHWYGGFQSYITATEFGCPIFVPASHCKRVGEEGVPNLKHLPWIMWNDWIHQLSTFKYAVNLMPTVAAGTFSLNCAYLGIPCIGNEKVDTQAYFFPELSIDVNDIHSARYLAINLKQDQTFYQQNVHRAKTRIFNIPCRYTDPEIWRTHMMEAIYG